MTQLPGPGGPRVPRTAVEWARVRAAKLDALARDPLSLRPDDYPDVRPEVVVSWRRSMLAGVDPQDTVFPVDEQFQPGTRLAAVAQPIMNRLKDEISDLNSWGFLTDRACRLMTAVVGDFPDAGRVHRLKPAPGACFAEDVIGTNGLGCAHELQQPFLISGTEHFRDDSEVLTTTGVIIRDPFTKRYAGTLGVACRREYGSAAVLPLVVEIGRSIEAQLLASRTDGEREFFDAFTGAQRRFRGPVVGVSKRLCVVSTRARELVHEADEELLRRIAEESGPEADRTLHRRLSSGATVAIRVLPVPQPKGEFAAVLVLDPVAGDDGASDPGRAATAEAPQADVRTQLARALRSRRPTLLTGERGCGKRHEARAALRVFAGPEGLVELDGALAQLDPDGWLRALSSALDGHRAALVAHVNELPSGLAATVADLVDGARTPLVGTTVEDGGAGGGAVLLRERFPVVVAVPPLRERRDAFAELCHDLLTGLAEDDGRPVGLSPQALAALVASDWPGNIRQLLQVLATARVRAAGPRIDLADLPARHHPSRGGRPLSEIQRSERQVLVVALREAGGDRTAVMQRLGISRATLYRKLKRYELR